MCAVSLLAGVISSGDEPDVSLLYLTADDYRVMYALKDYLQSEGKEHLYIPVAKLELQELLESARQLEATEPDHANETRKFAGTIAFTIAQFTFPGRANFSEPISEEQQSLGLQAAKISLELSRQTNNLTPDVFWMLGAHQLNAKQYDEARKSFEDAKELAGNDSERARCIAWQSLVEALR